MSKARGGCVPDNSFASVPGVTGLRTSIVTHEQVLFADNLLPSDFRLVIKHPNFFTATLPTLLAAYLCYAIVRNPLAALLSWQSIQAPVNDGHLPFGEAFDPDLTARLAAAPDRLERQLILLRWYFSNDESLLPRDHVIRYGDLIESGGRALAVIDPDGTHLAEPLESRNTSRLYDASLVQRLADRLLADDSIDRGVYTRGEVERLRAAWAAPGRP